MLSKGPTGLTDTELLALILGATGQVGVIETSRELLIRFGGLVGLGRCKPGALMQVPGIGEARACALAAVVELARRLTDASVDRGAMISCSTDGYRQVRSSLALLDHERFIVVALDARHRVLALDQVAQGSATSVEVHPREVFALLVRQAATAAIVAHNHPSGDPEPSLEDRRLTERLKEAGEILGIPLLDHLVVGSQGYVSLADRGLL
jgi:DNA repair protein RadC